MENSVQTRSERSGQRFRTIQHFLDDPPVIEQERLLNTRIERYGSRSRRKQKASLNSLRLFLAIVCIGVFGYCAFMIASYLLDGYQSAKLIDTIRDQLPAAAPTAQAGASKQPDRDAVHAVSGTDGASMQEYQALLAINPDAVGWISIPDTNISYPVVRAQDNVFYLTHNFDQKQSAHGSIFMDYRNDGTRPDSHILIYGHNMRDGSMFGQLLQYKNASFYQAHPNISLNLRGEPATWQIFSVNVLNDDALPVDFSAPLEFAGFVQSQKASSLYNTGVTAGPGDQILTLSTCSHDYDNARFTVHAKKMAAAN